MKISWRFIGQGKTFTTLFALFEHFIFLGEMVWVGWLVWMIYKPLVLHCTTKGLHVPQPQRVRVQNIYKGASL